MHRYSLIIPTHERPDYLRRALAYFRDFAAEVLVCDSSAAPYCGELPAEVRYFHLPGMRFPDKMLQGLEAATAPYVAVCADDDFLVQGAVEKGVSLLQESPQLQAVIGNYAFFNKKFDGRFYPLYAQRQAVIFNQRPDENARNFFSNYHMLLWALFTKEALHEAYGVVRDARLSNDNFIEFILGCICCARGGLAIMEDLWGVREVNVGDHWGRRHPNLSTIASDESIQRDLQKVTALVDARSFAGMTSLAFDSYTSFASRTSAHEGKGILERALKVLGRKVRAGLGGYKRCVKDPSLCRIGGIIVEYSHKN